jgi:hypothetical protein
MWDELNTDVVDEARAPSLAEMIWETLEKIYV